MRINTNLIALNTKNQLKKNNKITSNIMEKLSSGKRINKAADDAAGLAISQKMRAQIRGLDQANENVQDGVSLIQTAEGALSEMEAMTQRMRELSVQGANDTLTTEDREKIQKELDALKEQVDVIANTTEFNTKKLLNGEIQTEMKSVTQSLDLDIPLDGSTVSTSIDIEGETINLDFTDDLSGNTEVNIKESGNILLNDSLKKANEKAEIIWEKSYGGSKDDRAYDMIKTSDGGYVISGYTYSDDGDVGENDAYINFWLTKIDKDGNLEWESKLDKDVSGYFSWAKGFSLLETDDGFVVSGNINHDFGIAKFDSIGNHLWSKSYGGTSIDEAYDMKKTIDGGYILAGVSNSDDGDVTNNNGFSDYWIIKLDEEGNLEWQETFGSSSSDKALGVELAHDGGYIISGHVEKSDGDVSETNGWIDYLVIKLDEGGNLVWQESYGGSSLDYGNDIYATKDSGYIITGYSYSDDGDVSNNNGSPDIWLTKIDISGQILWEENYGGSETEYVLGGHIGIEETSDNGFIVSSASYSDDGDVTNNNGWADYWIFKINESGNMEWQNNFGGSGLDSPNSILVENDSYVISGFSNSSDYDVTKNNGDYDFWIIKINKPIDIINSVSEQVEVDQNLNKESVYLDNIELIFENNKYEKVTDIKANYSVGLDDGIIIQTGANAGQQMKININDMRSEALGMTNGYPKVIPRENAEISIEISDKAIRKLSNERSRLGAKQKRLEHISKNLTNTSENLQNAESRIADADMAKQAMKLAKNNILIQAAQSMLAQANNLPQGVLQLLK